MMDLRWRFSFLVILVLSWSGVALAENESPADISTPRGNLRKLAKDPSVEGDPNRCDISLVGKIGPGTARKFKSIFGSEETENEFNSHTTTLCLDSTGGLASEALEIARFIVTQHADSISTVVQDDAVCASACALIFLAGREKSRLGPSVGRYLQPHGKLKFHPTYLRSSTEKSSEADEAVDRFLKGEATRDEVLAQYYSSGLRDIRQIIAAYGDTTWFADYIGKSFASASLFLELFSQSPDEWLCMDTVDKVGRWGIRLVGFDRALIPKQKYYNICRNAYVWGHDEYAADNWRPDTPGRAIKTPLKKNIAGRNVDLDDGFDDRYLVDIDFGVKAQKCVVEEKKWGTYSTLKVYFLNVNGGLVSGIYETNDAGFFAPATPISELGTQAARTKEDVAPKLNPAFPRFAKRQERAMACELKRLEAADIDTCEAYCTNSRDCVGFSYNKSSKACSLKHTSSALRHDPLWETGMKPGFQVPKDSIRSIVMDPTSPYSDIGFVLKGKLLDTSVRDNLDACADYCLSDQSCRGVTFATGSSQCLRFETVEKVSKDPSDQMHDGSGAIEYTQIAIKRQK
jgi:ATP-dependent protease ClpP protease subunit